jgi:probable phosphoglycerate mutase
VLAAHPQSTVVVVTHVTPIKTLVLAALEAPPSALFRMELSPASVSEIQWYAGGAASVRSFNEIPPPLPPD